MILAKHCLTSLCIVCMIEMTMKAYLNYYSKSELLTGAVSELEA